MNFSGCLYKGFHFGEVFFAAADISAGAGVNAPGLHRFNCRGNIVRVEAAGKNDRPFALLNYFSAHGPVMDFSGDADHAGHFSASFRIITGIGIKNKEVGNLLVLAGNRQ